MTKLKLKLFWFGSSFLSTQDQIVKSLQIAFVNLHETGSQKTEIVKSRIQWRMKNVFNIFLHFMLKVVERLRMQSSKRQ